MYVYCILFVPLRSHVSASLYVVVNLLALQDTNINETTVFSVQLTDSELSSDDADAHRTS